MNLDHVDPDFVKDLKASNSGVICVSEMLSSAGMTVILKGLKVRPDVTQRVRYMDDGDLDLCFRIEVKHTNLEFTDYWRFPTIIVCDAHKIDRATRRPLGFIQLNRDMSHGLVIPWRHRPKFVKESRYMRNGGRTEEVYTCNKDLATFFAVADGGRVIARELVG